MATIDGVAANSEVRRQVLRQINHFRNALRGYNPDNFTPTALVRNKTPWMSKFEEMFENLVDALTAIESDPDANQENIDDVNRLTETMTDLYHDFIMRYEAKCDTVPVPAAQPAALPAAGMFPGLQAPAPMTNAASPAHSAASTASEQSLARRAQNHVTVESEDVIERINELHAEFTKVTDWSGAEDHVVELEMTKIKVWRERMDKLKEKVKTLRVKTLDHDLDMAPYTMSKTALDSANGELEFIIGQMEHEDRERGLYSLNPGKAANLTYPTFSGADSEDYFKFKKEVENCFRGNRVRKEDQVTVLKKELKGEALKLLPSNITSITTAWDLLDQIYGDPKRILLNRKGRLNGMAPFYKLDKFGGNAGRSSGEAKQMVDWLISVELILEDLFNIAKKSVDMNNSVFTEDLYSTVAKLFSANVLGEINKRAGSYKDKLEGLFAFVQDKKDELKPFLAQSVTTSSSSSGSAPASGSQGRKGFSGFSGGHRGSRSSGSTECGFFPIVGTAGFTSFKKPQRFDSCRICKLLDQEGDTDGLYEQHHTDNPIGCPVFAQMDIATRHTYAKRAKLCLHCLDGDYVFKYGGQRHVDCVAREKKDRKWYFTCNEEKCFNVFLICPDHKQQNRDKLNRTAKWWQERGKSFVHAVSMSTYVPSVPAAPDDSRPPPTALTAHESDPVVTKRLEKVAPPGPPISPPPPGEPLFLFSEAKGKTRPVNVFYDGGCSHMLAKEGVPGKEIPGVKLREGPLSISAAGDTSVKVNAEWAILMETVDNKRQTLVGVTCDDLTSTFPLIKLAEAHQDILNDVKKRKLNKSHSDRILNLKVPTKVGGAPDILLGIKYQRFHPEIVHMTPSGLFLAKVKLLGHDKKITAAIGGPHKSFDALLQRCGDTANVMSVFLSSLKQWREYGPPSIAGPMQSEEDLELARKFNNPDVLMITGHEEEGPEVDSDEEVPVEPNHALEDNDVEAEVLLTDGFSLQCSGCGEDVQEDVRELVDELRDQVGNQRIDVMAASIGEADEKLADLKLVVKFLETGINLDYRCPSCRSCSRCRDAPQTERLSLREEMESEAIKESVFIDFKNKKIIGRMPMRGDPVQYLSNNRKIAEKVLEGQCRKVQKDPEAKETVLKAFRKLTDNGYCLEFNNLTPEQKALVESQEVQHWLPWRLQYKESVSTPCRAVMDASTKTPLLESGRGGHCLNNVVMKGVVNTLNLVNMILRFVVGPTAFNADLKQFYNRIALVEDQWSLQRILFKRDLDPEADTIEMIIISLIYGVRCVSAMSEQAVLDLAETVRNKNPRLADLLQHARFCDDIGDSDKDLETVNMIKREADELFSSAGLEVKAWSTSGSPPCAEVTHDGASVDIAGMCWYPEIDTMVVKVPPIHFGSKHRGKLRVGTEVFSGTMAELERFVPATLTRRQIVSKYSAFFDPVGHYLPFSNVMKTDARRATMETETWDSPVSAETRLLWVNNLWRMHNLQGIHLRRAIVPEDAVNLELEIVAAADAADLKIAGVWGRFLRSNGQYSCQLLIGRSLLCKPESTVPKDELESLTIASNLLYIARKALESWTQDYILIGDSVISICWVTSENKRMSIFHRNRVNQIKRHTDIDKIMHVKSSQNPSDIGSRPAKVKDSDMGPGSYWENGLPWMSQSVDSAINSDILKPSAELRLVDKDEEEEFDKGFVIEREIEVLVKGHTAMQYRVLHSGRVDRMAERALFSDYLFAPVFSFSKVVSITALVIKFVNKLKERVVMRKPDMEGRLGKSNVDEKIKLLPANVVTEFAGLSWTHDSVGQGDNAGDNKPKIQVTIEEEDVQRALIYWYTKASGEVKHFVKKETLERIAVEKSGILFARSRIMDGQRLVQAAEFSSDSVGRELGLNLHTPVIDRHSMIALSIAVYIHHEVSIHAGYESCFRQSLEYCFIIQGSSLFKEIGLECCRCHKIRRKFIDVAMGPVSDSQLTIQGPFHNSFLDLDGPYTCFVPGFERETRNRKCLAVKNYLMIFACPVTKLLNIQVIESRNTQSVMEGLTRMGCEQGFPAMLILDQESSFMKIVREAEINLVDLNNRCFKEFGIKFYTAPVGAHNYIGLVERKIRSVQQCFEKIELKNHKLHATGLQTIAKLVENQLNNLPLGYSFGRDSMNSPLLRLITPNMFRVGRLNSRALTGPVKLPRGPRDMMTKVEKLYDAFFQIMNIVMVPRLIPTPKWFSDSPELSIDDVIYFKKVENDLYSQWTIGQVDSITRSKDNSVRRVDIRYHNAGETGLRTTDRCVRSLVRLFNVEDDYWVRDMEKVAEMIKEARRIGPEEPVVEPLRVLRSESGNYSLLSDSSLNNSRMSAGKCRCCCAGHCAMMSHDLEPRVYSVATARIEGSNEMVATAPDFPYVKEKVENEERFIIPEGEYDYEDEMFEMFTAVERDFTLA